MKFTRNELIKRHRLSVRQADDFLEKSQESEDRVLRMKKLRELGFFLKLLEGLQAEGMDVIILKGPALSQKLYGDPLYRTSNDFDLLFSPGDLSKAVKFFHDRGFEGTKFSWPASQEKQKAVSELINQYFIFHPELGINIEIHWKLFEKRFAVPSSVEKMVWKNTEIIEINGQAVKTLKGEFELLYLVIHGSSHAWFRLKWLVDVHRFLKQNPINRKRFKNLTGVLEAERFVSVCNGLLKQIFPGTGLLPGGHDEDMKGLIKEAMYQLMRDENDPFNTFKNTLRLVRYQLALSRKPAYKLDVLRVLLFNKRDLNIEWLPAGRYSLFLFRPLTFIMRKFGWVA